MKNTYNLLAFLKKVAYITKHTNKTLLTGDILYKHFVKLVKGYMTFTYIVGLEEPKVPQDADISEEHTKTQQQTADFIILR